MTEDVLTRTDRSKTLAKGRYRVERAFVQIDRTAAWLSAILLLLFFVSGYGMTKPDFVLRATGGLVTWRVAYDMHNLLIVPLMITFVAHTISGLRRVLIRRTKRRGKTTWVAVGVGGLVFVYLLILALAPTGF